MHPQQESKGKQNRLPLFGSALIPKNQQHSNKCVEKVKDFVLFAPQNALTLSFSCAITKVEKGAADRRLAP